MNFRFIYTFFFSYIKILIKKKFHATVGLDNYVEI